MTTKTTPNNRIRAEAVQYAKQFLARKYRKEYRELYRAYCANRGVIAKPEMKGLVDERLLPDVLERVI